MWKRLVTYLTHNSFAVINHKYCPAGRESRQEVQKVTKTDLIDRVAKDVEGITKKKAADVVDAVFAQISKTLVEEGKVQIVGFGTFEVQKRAARQGRNPQDPQKVIDIPAKTVPVFRAGKALKESVNAGKIA